MSHTPNKTPAASASGSPAVPPDDRRGFAVKATATVLGGILVVFPFAAGLATFFSPLTRKKSAAKDVKPSDTEGLIPVTTLDAIPADGTPKRFAVITDMDDAWNHYRNVPVGSVYLRRTPSGEVKALNTTCPHAGCFVNFDAQVDEFKCPCHNSFFKLDGAIIEPSPSPRAMDSLEVKVDPDTKIVSVKYQNFYTGIADKKVKS